VEAVLDRQQIARSLLLVFCAAQVVATPAIDFNRTHATNPMWTRHARFHVVWQIMSQCLFSVLAGWLAWSSVAGGSVRFYLGVAILGVPLLGFLMAAVTRGQYGGGLYDPNGILPMRLEILGKQIELDLSLVVVLAGCVFLILILMLYRW
jgi:hypothetical protein